MKFLFSIIIITQSFLALAQNTYTIKGKIIDSISEMAIPLATIYAKNNQIGSVGDMEGNFIIKLKKLPDTLVISELGYTSLTLYITSVVKEDVIIKMKESMITISEVTLVGYKDPGKHIIEMVIKNKNSNNLLAKKTITYNEYRRNKLEILNIDGKESKGYLNKIASVYSSYNNDSLNYTAPLYFTEKYYKIYNSNHLNTLSEHLISQNKLDFKFEDLAQKLDKFEFRVNIYDNVIPILKTSFINPASKIGLLYYKFTPLDTLTHNGRETYVLKIEPKIGNENTFEGDMWVDSKSSAIVKYHLITSKGSNINFIDHLEIREEYNYNKDNDNWTPSYLNTDLYFNNGLSLLGIPVKTDTNSKKLKFSILRDFANYEINPDNTNAVNFYTSNNDSLNTSEFNENYRLRKLGVKDEAIFKMVDSLKGDRKYRLKESFISFLLSGYWDFGDKIRVGPYSSIVSSNQVEGIRIRSGFWTLPGLSKRFNFNGYMAYGTKDKAIKGGLGIKYVPYNKKLYKKTELYVRSDFDALGEFDDELDKDNVLTLGLAKNVNNIKVFTQQVKLLQEIELNHNWTTKAFYGYRKLTPTVNSIFSSNPIKTNEVGLSFRYAHNERTTIFNYDKIRIFSSYPVFKVDYIYGFNSLKNSIFNYHKFVVNVSQEIILPIKGSLYYSLSAGKMLGKAPVVLMFSPAGNAFYVTNRNTFNNMIPYEFSSDKYASLMMTYNMGGIILNKIPLLNKIKLRERIIFNNYLGTIRKENLGYNEGSSIKGTGLKPYSEVGVGVGNILNILAIDVVWRVSQFNKLQKRTKFGVFASVQLKF